MSTSKKDKFIANFMDQAIADPVSAQQSVREEALQALQELEFPTLRDEAWKYTRVAGVLKQAYEQKPAQGNELPQHLALEGPKLVFVNGFFDQSLSNTEGVAGLTIKPLANARIEDYDVFDLFYGKYADHKGEVFTALNTAFNRDGVFIEIHKGAVIDHPISIIHHTSGDGVTYQPRLLVVANEQSQAQIIHEYTGNANEEAFTNTVAEVLVGEHAQLAYHVIEMFGEAHRHIQTTQVYQNSNSRFNTGAWTFGGGLVRNNLNIEVDGAGCETNLNGIYITDGTQHIDNHTVVDHMKHHCQSNENYKGVLTGKSTGVFNGKVFVRPDAQVVNAFQSNQNILLSDDAAINSKPELEIYADDVKCSHGSTTGELDEDALFYLQARGIPLHEARKLMLTAFTQEALELVEDEALLNYLQQVVTVKSATLT